MVRKDFLRNLSLAALLAAACCQEERLNDTPKGQVPERQVSSGQVQSEQISGEQTVVLDDYLENSLDEILFDGILHEKEEDRTNICLVDLSNNFIPPLLRLSKDWKKYFTTKGILSDPFERERFGIFSSFEHYQKPFQHYKKAIEMRGKEKQLLIKGSMSVKNIQKILSWEGFYEGEINGIYDNKTIRAVILYQRYNQKLKHDHFYINNLLYILHDNGQVDKATRELMNRSLEDYAMEGIKRVLEERVFHMRCLFGGNVRSPHVIEQDKLDKLVAAVAEQAGLSSLQGIEDFFKNQPEYVRVRLEIPGRYKKDYLQLGVEIEKWSSKKRKYPSLKTKYTIYSLEDGKRVELFRTRAVVGGWNKLKGRKKFFNTPEGRRYIKSHWIMPYWTPPNWAEEKKGDIVTLPGPYNAFGMSAMIMHLTNKEPKDIFKGWYDDDEGIRNHLTPWPSSVEYGGFSHGCIRIHPKMSRVHFFITRFTPHTVVLEDGNDGEQYLKFTELKGSYLPYKPENYVPVDICKEECR